MSQLPDDPVFKSSRREAIVALITWAVCACYTLTYCFLNGYHLTSEEVTTYWGIPSWVLFGIWLPWTCCNVFAWWFCFRFIEDGDLGEDPPEDEETGEERP